MTKPIYSEKLQDPRWQKKRLEVFQRDDFRCTTCKNTTVSLQIHHLEYIGSIDPWEYPMDMLTTLCRDCHGREQQRPRYETDLITSLKMNGFVALEVWHLATKLYNDKRFREHLKSVLSK